MASWTLWLLSESDLESFYIAATKWLMLIGPDVDILGYDKHKHEMPIVQPMKCNNYELDLQAHIIA